MIYACNKIKLFILCTFEEMKLPSTKRLDQGFEGKMISDTNIAWLY